MTPLAEHPDDLPRVMRQALAIPICVRCGRWPSTGSWRALCASCEDILADVEANESDGSDPYGA